MSSLYTMISCPKHFIRQGLLRKWGLLSLDRNLPVNEESMGLRGRTEFAVMSKGPGTKTKCVPRAIGG